MKHILLAFLFLLLLGLAALISVRLLKLDADQGAQDAGRLFIYRLAHDYPYDAFRSTAAKIQASRFARFESSLDAFGLIEGVDVNLASPMIGSNEATIHGSFQRDGEPRNVTLNLIFQGGRWKVYSILSDQSGDVLKLGRSGGSRRVETKGSDQKDETGETTASGEQLPSHEALQELVRATMMSFNEAVQLRYFALFYQQISQAWQQQTTPSKLTAAFAGFMEKKISFPEIANITATFDKEPNIDADGLLHINGHYPHSRHDVYFAVRYTYEHPKWRLFGIDVDIVEKKGEEASLEK